jgi:hypothetical protein
VAPQSSAIPGSCLRRAPMEAAHIRPGEEGLKSCRIPVAGLAKIHLQHAGQEHDFRVIFLVTVAEDHGRNRFFAVNSAPR